MKRTSFKNMLLIYIAIVAVIIILSVFTIGSFDNFVYVGDILVGLRATVIIAFLLFAGATLVFLYQVLTKYKTLTSEIDKMFEAIISKDPELYEPRFEDPRFAQLQKKAMIIIMMAKSSQLNFQKEQDVMRRLVNEVFERFHKPLSNLEYKASQGRSVTVWHDDDKLKYFNELGDQIRNFSDFVATLEKMLKLESQISEIAPTASGLKNTIKYALSGAWSKAEVRNISIDTRVEDVMLYHDPRWTGEAIFNIVDNAIKYAQTGAKIRIKSKVQEIYTQIDIIDNGPGIAKEDEEKVFTRFYRGKNVGDVPGYGLGLYITRHIIDREGGKIELLSKQGVGTIFSIYLQNCKEPDPSQLETESGDTIASVESATRQLEEMIQNMPMQSPMPQKKGNIPTPKLK